MTANTTRLTHDEKDPVKRSAAHNQAAEKLDNLTDSFNTFTAGLLANPTGSIGLTAVNGVATTATRSDGTHALSQAIVPTWTGVHTFGNTTDSTSSTTGGAVFSGGIGIAKNIVAAGKGMIGSGSLVYKLNVSANTGNLPSNPGGLGADIMAAFVNADGSSSRLGIFAAGGANNKLASINYFTSRGTLASPTAIQAGDFLGSNLWLGSDGSAYLTNAGFVVVAAATFAAGVGTAHLDLYSGQEGQNARLWASGGLSMGVATDPGAGAFLATASVKSNGATAGIGYATGAGGTVTQATSKNTGVTLNKAAGQITTNNSGITAGASQGFTLTNSAIAATDVVIINMASGGTADSYEFTVDAVAAGSCRISIRNKSAGNLSEALVLNFAVIKAVIS